MVRQQRQSRLGIFSLKVVETYRTNRKPDCASERSICFFPSLDFVYPVSSDRLVLNNDGDFHSGVPSVSGERKSYHNLLYEFLRFCTGEVRFESVPVKI